MKNKKNIFIFLLFFLISLFLFAWFNKYRKSGEKIPDEKSNGATFPQEKEYSMQLLERSVLDVPSDYSIQTAKLDEEIEAKANSLIIESQLPKVKFSTQ